MMSVLSNSGLSRPILIYLPNVRSKSIATLFVRARAQFYADLGYAGSILLYFYSITLHIFVYLYIAFYTIILLVYCAIATELPIYNVFRDKLLVQLQYLTSA